MAKHTHKASTVSNIQFLLERDVLTCKEVHGDIEQLTGYCAEDFLAARPSFADVFHPDDQDVRNSIFSVGPLPDPVALTFRVINKTGQVKILSATYHKYADVNSGTCISVSIKAPSDIHTDLVKNYALSNYLAMLEDAEDFIYFKNREHVFTGASQTLVDITEGTQLWTDLIGKVDYDVFPREYADEYYKLEKQIFSGSAPVAREIQSIVNRQGQSGWVDNRKYAMVDKAGNIVGLFGIARDITELVETEKKLRKSEERVRLALLAANQAWFDLDIKTGKVDVSDEYPSMLGFALAEFHSDMQEWQDNLHPEDREAVLAALNQCIMTGGPTSMEYRRRTKNGEWLWLLAVAKVVEWDDAKRPARLIGIHTNIQQRKQMELELQHKADTDYLTEVNNRGHFMELGEKELSRSLRYQVPLAILMLDIDWFKKINDSHGHKLGDMVLKKLADICKGTLREIDIIGRIGGEEFAILLPETELPQAEEVAERLRAAIADTKIPMKDGLPVQFTVSIGVASVVSGDDNMDVLLNRADSALYQAKETGRNRVSLAPSVI